MPTRNLNPSSIIILRASLHEENKPKEIHALYDESSDLLRFFPEVDDYAEHFFRLTKGTTHAGVQIVKERESGGLAQVSYIERIIEDNEIVQYYSKTTFRKTPLGWRITKEERERVALDDNKKDRN